MYPTWTSGARSILSNRTYVATTAVHYRKIRYLEAETNMWFKMLLTCDENMMAIKANAPFLVAVCSLQARVSLLKQNQHHDLDLNDYRINGS